MSKVKCIALAAALVMSGATFALAQNGQPTGSEQPVAGGANGSVGAPGSNESGAAPRTARRSGTIVHHKTTKHHMYRPQ